MTTTMSEPIFMQRFQLHLIREILMWFVWYVVWGCSEGEADGLSTEPSTSFNALDVTVEQFEKLV